MKYMRQLYASFGDKWRITVILKTSVLGPSVSVWYTEAKYRNTDVGVGGGDLNDLPLWRSHLKARSPVGVIPNNAGQGDHFGRAPLPPAADDGGGGLGDRRILFTGEVSPDGPFEKFL